MQMPPSEAERLLAERFKDPNELRAAIARYDNGEPLAYITGIAYFYGETYRVSPSCLIPRPDTERLVDRIIKHIGNKRAELLDLCTGSGCIAISSAAHCAGLNVTAADISGDALVIARDNAALNGVAERVRFVCGDIFDAAFRQKLGSYDIISSNPPYIASAEIASLDESVKREPMIALDGGADGMDFYRLLTSEYKRFLKKDGVMLLEIGYDQADGIRAIAADNRFGCEIYRDYGGNDRVAELIPL